LVAGFAPIASPTFTGVPAAPTPGNNTNSTQLATTAFLRNYLAAPTVGFGTTTPNSGAFTSLTSGSGALNGTLGGLVRNTANFTTINATGTLTGADATFTTLSSSGNDALLYQNSSAQSIPSSVATTLTGWTLFSDRVGSNFNASTGVFTAPATGVYIVSGQINFAATAEVVATTYQLLAVGNGVTVASGSSTGDAAGTYNVQVQLPGVAVALAAGQTLVLQALQNSGGARSLGANAVQTFISIYRTP